MFMLTLVSCWRSYVVDSFKQVKKTNRNFPVNQQVSLVVCFLIMHLCWLLAASQIRQTVRFFHTVVCCCFLLRWERVVLHHDEEAVHWEIITRQPECPPHTPHCQSLNSFRCACTALGFINIWTVFRVSLSSSWHTHIIAPCEETQRENILQHLISSN